jgi:hypothetical protein
MRRPCRLRANSRTSRSSTSKKGNAMNTLAKLGVPLAVVVALSLTSVPAHAQLFKEEDMGQMKQFAPMFEMMKQTMGKKRYGAMMRKMGPMMARMGNNGNGLGGNFGGGFGAAPTGGGFDGGGFSAGSFGDFSGGDFGGFANMFGSGQGMGDLRGLIGGFTGRHGRRGWRHRHAG